MENKATIPAPENPVAKSFSIGATVSQVIYAQGTPDDVLSKESFWMPYLSDWDGLSAVFKNLSADGFIFLWKTKDIFAGTIAFVVFKADGTAIYAHCNPGYETNFRTKDAI